MGGEKFVDFFRQSTLEKEIYSMKLLRRMLPIAIFGLALLAKAEEFDEEIGDDTVQVNEVLDEDEGEDMGLVEEENQKCRSTLTGLKQPLRPAKSQKFLSLSRLLRAR